MNFVTRQRNLREALQRAKLDALLVTHLPNVRYLCGFTGSAAALIVPANGRPVFLTDGRYTEQARQEVSGARVVISRGPLLAEAAKHVRRGALGIEAERMTLAEVKGLKKGLPAGIRLRETAGLVERLRLIKEEDELAVIRQAVRLGSSLFPTALKALRRGKDQATTESAVAAAIEYAARTAGASGMAFETIVAAGRRSALPHGVASAQRLPHGGFVVLDYGVILAGYCSDMARTVHVGKPSARARGMYDAVLDAQLAALEAVRPGATAGEVDQAARRVLEKAGLGRWFTHSTGHGVGLEIHEIPRLARRQKDVLEPGMVITIEPGAYVPGFGGVRIEDMVAVTRRGREVLTPTTKELLIL
ncbi:MAG TPA: Xaa-Pro peptidase family protein [Terriglobales bacterium]|nr:Xaa-Pro peptidase family protein [Terriglobales bacterium]